MQNVIVLDYTDGKVKYFYVEDDLQCEDIEHILYEHYGFKQSQIEWMCARDISLEQLEQP